MSLTGRIRHYWSYVTYDSYYLLQGDGSLRPLETDAGESFDHDLQWNVFNLDMTYRWEFAPGSEVLVNWKSSSDIEELHGTGGYWHSLRQSLTGPRANSVSFKFLYYLDCLRF
jgi:hypothetical protein